MLSHWEERVKLGVFIGSPKRNLEAQRDQIIRAVLEAGHIPEGMELWKAGNRPTKQEIDLKLQVCDVHIMLLGESYGSIVPNEDIGFAEWEFQRSEEANRPVLAFLLETEALHKAWQKNPPTSEEQNRINKLRQRLLERAICKLYRDTRMEGIGQDVIMSISEAIGTGVLPSDAGWIRSRSVPRNLRWISDNEFLFRIIKRVFEFSRITERLTREARAKRAAAMTFWGHKLNQIKRASFFDLFFESGSSLAYVSEAFEEATKEDTSPWRVATNNAMALLQLLLFAELEVKRIPPSAPDPLDKYGAIFTKLCSKSHEEPPVYPRALFPKESDAIEEIVGLLTQGESRKRLILSCASGWDTDCCTAGFRGPHVGSHANMLFKRAIFKTNDPVVIFLTRGKITSRASFRVRECYPVFGEELPMETALSKIPLAICVGYEIDEDESTTLPEIAAALKEILRPVLEPHGFDLDYVAKDFASDRAGAFIAANPLFIELFPKC